jgi:hypothetical protein
VKSEKYADVDFSLYQLMSENFGYGIPIRKDRWQALSGARPYSQCKALEIPNPKSKILNNFKILITKIQNRFEFVILKIGAYLEFGAWSLVLPLLCSGWVPLMILLATIRLDKLLLSAYACRFESTKNIRIYENFIYLCVRRFVPPAGGHS